MRRRYVILIVLMAIALVIDSVAVVDETQVGLGTRFGRVVSEPLLPGLHWIAPRPVGGMLRIDRRLRLTEIPATEFLTADKKNLVLNAAISWRIADPLLFVQRIRSEDIATSRLIDLGIASLGASTGRLPSSNFFSIQPADVHTRQLAAEVQAYIGSLARSSFGIQVEQCWIARAQFPEQNREAIIARMQAERERIALRIRAEGEETARKIEAEAEQKRRTLLAEAARDAEIARGNGEAEATRITAEAYARDPSLYQFIRNLELYEKSMSQNTTIFLDSADPVIRLFFQGPETEKKK
ncbi:MAG TPA: protease modulator HflC [Thermoanaerobaculia bacterium]|nr:protease modulator HflC [Thermoanaerobaculia bacterium]